MGKPGLCHEASPHWFGQLDYRDKDQLVNEQADNAYSSELNQLATGMALATFRKGPAPVEEKILDDRSDEAKWVGYSFRNEKQLHQNIDNAEMGDRPSGAYGGKLGKTLDFFSIGLGECPRLCDQIPAPLKDLWQKDALS